MIATFTVATLTALCIGLLAYAWRQHEQTVRLRIELEEEKSWAERFEDAANEQNALYSAAQSELASLRCAHGHLQSLYCDLVRRRLAETYPLIERNLKRN